MVDVDEEVRCEVGVPFPVSVVDVVYKDLGELLDAVYGAEDESG